MRLPINGSELATMRNALAKLVGQCDRKLERAACPIIEILEWDAPMDPSATAQSAETIQVAKPRLLHLVESQAATVLGRKIAGSCFGVVTPTQVFALSDSIGSFSD